MSEQSNRFRSQDQLNEELIGVPDFFADIRKRVEARERARAAQQTPDSTQSLGREILGLDQVFEPQDHDHKTKPRNQKNDSSDT